MPNALIVAALMIVYLWTGATDPVTQPANEDVATRPAIASTQPAAELCLQLALSSDGTVFKPDRVVIRNAAAPDLLRLPDGNLLAVFEPADNLPQDRGAAANSAGSFLVSRSKDEGKAWSPARPIHWIGAGARAAGEVHRPALVRLPQDHVIALYCIRSVGEAAAHSGSTPHLEIACAVTHNGLDYQWDDAFTVSSRVDAHTRLIAGVISRRIHLFVAHPAMKPGGREGDVEHYVSGDGHRFERVRDERRLPFSDLADIESTSKGPRAFIAAPTGLRSMTYGAGRRWRTDSGIRLAGAFAAAVVELKDKTHLMLNTALIDPSDSAPTTATTAPASAPSAEGDSSQAVSQTVAVNDAATEQGAVAAQDEDTWEAFTPSSVFSWDGLPPGSGGSDPEGPDVSEPFPPMADFDNPVDYVQWIRDRYVNRATDNAYEIYATYMSENATGNDALWSSLAKTMLNSDNFQGPVGPWSPAEHPDWAAGLQESGVLLDWFRQATWHTDYAATPTWSDGRTDGPLVEMLLPGLSYHRRLVKATLSDAWQIEDGQVSPERMLSDLDTSLRGAGHMMKGAYVIERLVGVAERRITEETALRALSHHVFNTTDQLVSAYNTLAGLDTDEGDPAEWLSGEHAGHMDAVQRIFKTDADGQLRVDSAGLQWFASMFGLKPEEVQAIQQFGPDEAHKTVETIDSHFRSLADQVREHGKVVDEQPFRDVEDNPLTRPMLSPFSRVFELRIRGAAFRRATQTAYAAHIYAAQNGHWPAALDELAPQFGNQTLTDPFTGGYFGYQLTPSGPRIYSMSDNGVDDGGVHSPRWGDPHEGASDDFVFWPPQ